MYVNVRLIFKGALFSIAVTFAVILVLSLITYFCDIDGKIITVGIYAGVVVGVTLGALAAAKNCERGALPHAMLVSVIYLAVLIGVSAAVCRAMQFNGHFATMTAGILASGFLGAVLGKN